MQNEHFIKCLKLFHFGLFLLSSHATPPIVVAVSAAIAVAVAVAIAFIAFIVFAACFVSKNDVKFLFYFQYFF